MRTASAADTAYTSFRRLVIKCLAGNSFDEEMVDIITDQFQAKNGKWSCILEGSSKHITLLKELLVKYINGE